MPLRCVLRSLRGWPHHQHRIRCFVAQRKLVVGGVLDDVARLGPMSHGHRERVATRPRSHHSASEITSARITSLVDRFQRKGRGKRLGVGDGGVEQVLAAHQLALAQMSLDQRPERIRGVHPRDEHAPVGIDIDPRLISASNHQAPVDHGAHPPRRCASRCRARAADHRRSPEARRLFEHGPGSRRASLRPPRAPWVHRDRSIERAAHLRTIPHATRPVR